MQDYNPSETQEWLEAFEAVVAEAGKERANFLLTRLLESGNQFGLSLSNVTQTTYRNTIPVEQEPEYPGNIELEMKILTYLRWNAVVMVLKAGKVAAELGGHIASYASSAFLYEVGFQHFFHAATDTHGGDLLYVQGHTSPGIYARAFLEGRLTVEQLKHFRQEIGGKGISSYPHPWLMPNFWQFATVSMGLGPLMAIYQARFLKYLENRKLAQTAARKIWVFCGDGEMDEPESLGAISLAARENLNNLIFVVNCNLQRLDGPVRGNGKIIQELEGDFRGAGWDVIKVVWGSGWDELLAKDHQGLLQQRMSEVVDGEYQTYVAAGPAYFREHFFGKSPELLAMVAHLSDQELVQLQRGGHDVKKIFAAYQRAVNSKDRPTVILAKTIKGYGMGAAGEAQNITHQKKKLSVEDLQAFCERFVIPASDVDIEQLNFIKPDANSPEMKYLQEQRKKLGGYLPARNPQLKEKLEIPELNAFNALLESTGDREISTTMAFVRILSTLLKDKHLGQRIVPIVPDESRTFGMEGLFRQIGIYSPHGQLYHPEDAKQVMYYREAVDGQILEEGITEAGGMASWIAAATSYSTNQLQMIPFYIYYSMFGFQRIGDFAWAAGDMQARGFLLGATSGRTTLAGEGLQHQDGHSHILASTIPNCVAYDPTYAYELAVLIHHGLDRMIAKQENVFFYITVLNENYAHPSLPANVEEGIIKGMYLLEAGNKEAKQRVQLLGCGAILQEVRKAAQQLWERFQIAADIWSVTSFNELRRDGLACERHNRLHPDATPKLSYVSQCLAKQQGPIIAATDYMKIFADQVRPFISADYYVLGTDGFGRSDTRSQLRYFFEVNADMIIYTALYALNQQGKFDSKKLLALQKELHIDGKKPNPTTV